MAGKIRIESLAIPVGAITVSVCDVSGPSDPGQRIAIRISWPEGDAIALSDWLADLSTPGGLYRALIKSGVSGADARPIEAALARVYPWVSPATPITDLPMNYPPPSNFPRLIFETPSLEVLHQAIGYSALHGLSWAKEADPLEFSLTYTAPKSEAEAMAMQAHSDALLAMGASPLHLSL